MKRNLIGTFSLIIIGVVFGIALASGFGWVRPSYSQVEIGSKEKPITALSPQAKSFNDAFVKVAEKVTPSIVKISVVQKTKGNPHKGLKFFFPFKDNIPFEQKGGGSGIIITSDGYILTNNHVVENAISVTVGLYDKREFEAEVIGTDPLTDLAVIKIDANNLSVAYLGNSDKLKVGTWVMAIGNPLSLTSTVTAGIVSAVGRNLNLIQDSYGVEDYIQTDAAINPGNSGGALVNLNGEVIGINSAIATNGLTSSYIGYGFAIPINLAKSVAKDLIASGKVNRGYIGVNISEVDASTAEAIGLPKPQGVMVQGIVKGSAASQKDIKPGDVILKVNDREVNMPNELQSYVAAHRAGDKVVLTIYRDGKIIKRTVKLLPREESKAIAIAEDNGNKQGENNVLSETKEYKSLGLTVRNATDEELAKFKIESGVMIDKVEQFSKADDQKLAPGVLIAEVNKKKIKSVADFDSFVSKSKGSAILLKVIYSDGTTRYVGLEIPKE